jgi:hypothetical protein
MVWHTARARLVLLVLLCTSTASIADAQSEHGSAYEGVQLAPTVHGAFAIPHIRGGVGLDLSVTRWFDLEVWGSRVSRPNGDRWYPGAWSTGLAVNSRVAWGMHAFVYGAGFVYTSRFDCPDGCTLLTTIALEEPRTAFDTRAVQLRLGYEARASNGPWFFRALTTVDLPFATGPVYMISPYDKTYAYHEPAATFLHVSVVLTLGYAFRLH